MSWLVELESGIRIVVPEMPKIDKTQGIVKDFALFIGDKWEQEWEFIEETSLPARKDAEWIEVH